ncbi:MAG: carbohydrate kinase family protein [Halorhabdus sp.]
MEPFTIVGVGLATWDLLFRLSGPPTFEGSTDVLAVAQQGGGPSATGAATASRLGGGATFVGAVGDDPYATMIREDFARFDVHDQLVVDADAASTVVAVLVETVSGERIFLGAGEGATLDANDVPAEPITSADCVLVDSHTPAAARQAAALAENPTVVADVEAVDDDIRAMLPDVDILIVPEPIAPALGAPTDEPLAGAESLRELGPSIVIITQGERGSVVAHPDGQFHQPAFDVDVVDTTGAGDVYHGAFAAGYCQDWKIDTVTEFATAVAAQNCTALGGRGALSTPRETFSFLAARSDRWTTSGPV